MNKVYRSLNDTEPLSSQELADAANAISNCKPFTADMFEGPDSRVAGKGHCYCNDNGEFVLLPVNDPDVQEGMKRYMQCRKCGGWSHL